MDSGNIVRRNLVKIVFDGAEYVWRMNKEGTLSSCSQCDLKGACDDSEKTLQNLCCGMIGYFAYFRKK